MSARWAIYVKWTVHGWIWSPDSDMREWHGHYRTKGIAVGAAKRSLSQGCVKPPLDSAYEVTVVPWREAAS